MIGPIFAKYSKEYKNIHFIKVDVDELEDVSGAEGIEGIYLTLSKTKNSLCKNLN